MNICRIVFLTLLFALLPLQRPTSASGPFGLGLVLGNPSAISFKYWMSSRNSLDGIIGLGGFRSGSLTLGLDWSHHWSELTPVRDGRFLLGLGGGFLLNSSYGFALRGKGIADYTFSEVPFNIFLELAPTLAFLDPSLYVTGGIGFRWFF